MVAWGRQMVSREPIIRLKCSDIGYHTLGRTMTDTDSDVVAITQLVNLYGLAVDSQRWELFDRIFATDVDPDYGAMSHWTDREQFKV